MKELINIKYWIFDLDNTLYSGDTKVFDQVDKKMSKYISNKLNVSIEEAKKILNDKIYELLKSKFLPVLSPMGLDEKNKKYNINADTAASALAKSIKARRLLLMTDVEGVYDENKKLISEINSKNAKKLIENKVVSGGMIPKLENCIDAVANGVRGVVIIDGRKPHSVLNEIFSDKGAGTLIRK